MARGKPVKAMVFPVVMYRRESWTIKNPIVRSQRLSTPVTPKKLRLREVNETLSPSSVSSF